MKTFATILLLAAGTFVAASAQTTDSLNTSHGSLELVLSLGNRFVYTNSAAFYPEVTLGRTLPGSFTDPNLPAGYAPFNIQNLGGKLYVAYAEFDPNTGDEVAGAGKGFVDVFDTDGNLLHRLIKGGPLNAAWGLALAPGDFGPLSNDLLVGNFGDGLINAFDPTSGNFLGSLEDPGGNPISIDGLWALSFGNGGSAGATNELFFTAGINDEADGLFGKLSVPEPSTIFLLGLGLVALYLPVGRKPPVGGAGSSSRSPWHGPRGQESPAYESLGLAQDFQLDAFLVTTCR